MIMEKITKEVVYGYAVFYRISSSRSRRIYSVHGNIYRTKSIREEVLSNALDILHQLDCEILKIKRFEHVDYESVEI